MSLSANPLEVVKRPCWDKETGKANPLVEMELAPSNSWTNNYKGATFGWTRISDGKSKMHNGIDLYATPGTPIYSMFDGEVSSSNYVVEQPMRNKLGYPKDYNGDKDGSGNRIFVISNFNGTKISVGYWHLMINTPIAINPRTGKPFAPGDKVYQGEIIAYSGRTGNAYNVLYPHLHLGVKVDGKYVDPAPYLNGNLSSTGSNQSKVVSSVEVKNIKCDEEEKELTIYY